MRRTYMAKVTGIGGVFFRSDDPEKTVAWYKDHLGIEPEVGHPSATMRWSGGETTVWAPFPADTDYFGDQSQPFMVNYRIDDLAAMLAQLRDAGIVVSDDYEENEYGAFGWAVDCDGRRMELWQPPVGD
jgi:catechol 2,3-dioxygenase-like lactoylglutathione lyase family enzyme